MICDAARAKTFAVIVANYRSEVSMKTLPRFLVLKIRPAVLRAEDEVNEEVRERLRHSVNFEAGFQPSGSYQTLYQGLRPRLG